MTAKEACEIIANRLRDEYGLERTPKQVGAFLMFRLNEFANVITQEEMIQKMVDLLSRLLVDPEQFRVFAADMKQGTTIGPMEGFL